MRKIVVVSLFLLTVIAIAFFGVPNANTPDIDIINLPTQFFTANETSTIEINIPVPTSESEIIQAVEDLYSSWITKIMKPGWLYVVDEVEQSPGDYGTLPNGTQIPADHKMKTWYLLDGEGIVLALVGLMENMNGNVVQRSVFTGTMWHNLTIGESWAGSPHKLNLYYRELIENLSKGSDWYGELSISELTLDGREVVEVVTTKGIHQFSAMFDLATGKPMGSCFRHFDATGVLRNYSCGKIVNITWESPPQGLLLDLDRLSSQ